MKLKIKIKMNRKWTKKANCERPYYTSLYEPLNDFELSFEQLYNAFDHDDSLDVASISLNLEQLEQGMKGWWKLQKFI